MRTAKNIILILCGLAVVAFLITGINYTKKNKLVSVAIESNKKIDQTPVEIKNIRNIGQWEFLSVQTEELVDTIRKGIFTDDRLVCIYQGHIQLGIDTHEAPADWITCSPDSAHVTLPAIRILNPDFIDEGATHVFYERGTWSDQALNALYNKAVRQMRQRALTPENIRQAEESAREHFKALLKSFGFKKVTIHTASSPEPHQTRRPAAPAQK